MLADIRHWAISSLIFGTKDFWGGHSSSPQMAHPYERQPNLNRLRHFAVGPPPVTSGELVEVRNLLRCAATVRCKKNMCHEEKQVATTENPGLPSDSEGMFCILSTTTVAAPASTRAVAQEEAEATKKPVGRRTLRPHRNHVFIVVERVGRSPYSSLTRSHTDFFPRGMALRVSPSTAVFEDQDILDELHRLIVLAQILHQRGARHREVPESFGRIPEAKWANP